MSESSPARPEDEWLWLLLVLVAGVLIRVWGLGSWDWEEDELYTLRDATDLGASAQRGGAPGITARPVYYLLQHMLLVILPPTRIMMRLLPFLFGILGVVATWWVARRLFGGYAGLVAAALAAFSPWHLYVSQFARYWSLVYLLATLTFGLFVIAHASNRRRDYLLLLAVFAVGSLTHPTFLFPMVGVVVALHLVTPEGELGLALPTRTAMTTLWIPLLLLGVLGAILLTVLGRPGAVNNLEARGLIPSLRLVPAMVQWMGVPVFGASLAGCALLVALNRRPGRQWAAMTVAGATGAFFLLLVASFRTGVYSDYGISVLPLLFVAIAGAVNGVAQTMPRAQMLFAMAAAGSIVVSVSPELASHLSDGSKFDYRPAFETIRQVAPDRPVFGRIDALQPVAAPDLQYAPLTHYDRENRPSGAWFITSQRRWGVREGGPRLERFLAQSCKLVGAFERPRLDYRLYRVNLHWCGSDPVPTRGAQQP